MTEGITITSKLNQIFSFRKWILPAAISTFAGMTYIAYSHFKTEKQEESRKRLPLCRNESEARKELIGNVKYKLLLQLKKEKIDIDQYDDDNSYEGEIIIEFDIDGALREIFLDYYGIVKRITVNHHANFKYFHHENRIYIDRNALVRGKNTIVIAFESYYYSKTNKQGEGGLIFQNGRNFQDTKCFTIYPQLEPYGTHFVFPCFDQPDIKCDLELFIQSINDIVFISNAPKAETVDEKLIKKFFRSYIPRENKNMMVTQFNEIKNISTHQLAITGGNFTYITDDGKDPKIAIYADKSALHSINHHKFIFSRIRQAIEWLSMKLSINVLANLKLDVVFVPLYESVGNSFPGVIIIDEKFLSEADTDIIDKNYFHFILVNSISQMWLANNVSLVWWDDSFFYEGLNLFLTGLFFEEHKNEYEICSLVYDHFKSKAIDSDRSVDSHSVLCEVNDTEEAEIFFDELTAFKSGALFRYFYSLDKLMMMNALKDFMREYISRAASRHDFFRLYSQHRDGSETLNQMKYYLVNPQIPKISCSIYKQEGAMFDKLLIIQEYHKINPVSDIPLQAIYYPYLLNVGLIYQDHSETFSITVLPKKVNIIQLEHMYPVTEIIILNYDDTAYSLQKYDDSMLKHFRQRNFNFQNETKLVIARNLFIMAKDGELTAFEFLSCAQNFITAKADSNVYIANKFLKYSVYLIRNFVEFLYQTNIKRIIFNDLIGIIWDKYEPLRKNLVNYLIDVIDSQKFDQMREFLSKIGLDMIDNRLNLSSSDNEEKGESYSDLTQDMPYDYRTKVRIGEIIFECPEITTIQKESFLSSLFKNEIRLYEKLQIKKCISDSKMEGKLSKTWDKFVYRVEGNSMLMYCLMKAFNRESLYNRVTCKYIGKRFFKDFPFVCNAYPQSYAILFYKNLNPAAFVNTEKILNRMITLRNSIDLEDKPKLRLYIERDIHALKNKLIVMRENNRLSRTILDFN